MNSIIDAGVGVCETRWYSDEVADSYEMNLLGGSSRELELFDTNKHPPLEKVIFQNNQAVLFNTDIYHDFDNSTNTMPRYVLTLRFSLPEDFYFENVLLILKKKNNNINYQTIS
jgi:hypothetical protein